jgi:hypothetical protein
MERRTQGERSWTEDETVDTMRKEEEVAGRTKREEGEDRTSWKGEEGEQSSRNTT